MPRQITPAVRAKLEQWEGLRLDAYLDGGGVPTIGFGHTGPEVRLGLTCTLAQARKWLAEDLREAESAVARLVKVALTDEQFGALVSFVFNVGVAAFARSTLLRKLNAGDYASVPAQLMRWNKDNGRVVPGLTNRRAAEAGLWASGAFVASANVPAAAAPRPLMQSRTVAGAVTTSAGVAGSTLLDTASQVQVVADYSDTLRLVFVALMLAGVGLTLYGRLRLRKEEGV